MRCQLDGGHQSPKVSMLWERLPTKSKFALVPARKSSPLEKYPCRLWHLAQPCYVALGWALDMWLDSELITFFIVLCDGVTTIGVQICCSRIRVYCLPSPTRKHFLFMPLQDLINSLKQMAVFSLLQTTNSSCLAFIQIVTNPIADHKINQQRNEN